MTLTFVENIRISKLPSSFSSQDKPALEVTAQMFGSGKSFLGLNFLTSLKSSQFSNIVNDIRIKYPEELKILIACIHIEVDMRSVTVDDNYSSLKVSLVGSILSSLPNTKAVQTFKNWILNQNLSLSFKMLFNQLEVITGYKIFLQLDDIDGMWKNVSESEQVKKYYHLRTNVLDDIIRTGTSVYITGRSSILYSIGRGLYRKKNLYSPTLCFQRILDPLEITHIHQLLKNNKKLCDLPNLEEKAEVIKKRTAGIPRFIEHAISILEDNPHDELGKTLLDRLDKLAPIELVPYYSLSDEMKDVYIELARIALLKVPIDLSLPVPPSVIFPSHDKDYTITTRDCIQLLNLYIMNIREENFVEEKYVYLVFPEVQLEALAKDKNVKEHHKRRLPFLSILYKSLPFKFWQTGEPFEECVIEAIYHRLILTIFSIPNLLYGEAYSFLSTSFMSKEPLVYDLKALKGKFPKFSSQEKTKKSTIKKFSKGIFDVELQQCFLDTSGKDMEVYSDYKEYVLNKAQNGVIYVSARASSAADVYIKAKCCYLGFQFKWGKQPFGHKDLISEITSAILSLHMPFVFVIVAQHLTNQFLSNQDGCPVLKDKEKHELGIIYNHTGKNSTIEKYTIPPHVQVII